MKVRFFLPPKQSRTGQWKSARNPSLIKPHSDSLVLRQASNPRHFLRDSHWIETFSLLCTQPGRISHVERFLMHQQFDFYPFHVSTPRCLFKVFAFIFAMNGIGIFSLKWTERRSRNCQRREYCFECGKYAAQRCSFVVGMVLRNKSMNFTFHVRLESFPSAFVSYEIPGKLSQTTSREFSGFIEKLIAEELELQK